eukprot:3742600-Amphidinium_carterae.1
MSYMGELNNKSVYKAAHAALQGRTTSTFEACHLLLNLPVVQFSRGNVWVQTGPPHTWVTLVPRSEEAAALSFPENYAAESRDQEQKMPVAQQRYRQMQLHFPMEKTEVP